MRNGKRAPVLRQHPGERKDRDNSGQRLKMVEQHAPSLGGGLTVPPQSVLRFADDQSQSRPPEIRALTGARALPPLILVLFHYCEGHGYRGAKWFDLPVAQGLSVGRVLLHAVRLRAHLRLWRRDGARFWRCAAYCRFLQSRLARLYPLHLAMLFVILVMVIMLRWVAARWRLSFDL